MQSETELYQDVHSSHHVITHSNFLAIPTAMRREIMWTAYQIWDLIKGGNQTDAADMAKTKNEQYLEEPEIDEAVFHEGN